MLEKEQLNFYLHKGKQMEWSGYLAKIDSLQLKKGGMVKKIFWLVVNKVYEFILRLQGKFLLKTKLAKKVIKRVK